MVESDKDSAAVGQDGSGDAPLGDNSTQQTDKPSGAPEIDPIKFFENPDFTEQIRRLFQSEKDKGVARVEREVGDIKNDLSRIAEKLNVPVEQVQKVQAEIRREDEWREMQEWYRSQKGSPNTKQGSEVDVDGSVQAILKAFGIEDDPAAQTLLAKTPGAKAIDVITNYAVARMNKPPASSAQIAAPPGGSTAVGGSFPEKSNDQLIVELDQLNQDPTNMEKRKLARRISAELTRREQV